MNRRTFSKLAALSALPVIQSHGWTFAASEMWHPAKGPLTTRWTKDVSPEHVLEEYPRPNLVRKRWINLNGLWEYAVTALTEGDQDQGPSHFGGKILVPFGIESQLSGVMKPFLPDQTLWYRRSFAIPSGWLGQRVLLHFDAVDFESRVWLNNVKLGEHKGGYDRFTFDITHAIKARGTQELLVSVLDPTNQGNQAHGKQSLHPRGASYTATSGIWRTVWLEPVPRTFISSIKMIPDVDASLLRLRVIIQGDQDDLPVDATAFNQDRSVAHVTGKAGEEIVLPVQAAQLWSPESPFLYDLKINISGRDGDEVSSYFGLRKISLGKDETGAARLFLNGNPVFQQGPLDQGFWPDGVYTAPTDDALKFDLEYMKSVGFNAVRKHVKMESDRWYYWADKLGILVWQDMPAGTLKTPESRQQWEVELVHHVENHFNHPSIVIWVIFNEGWGQYDTPRLTAKIRTLDPTRLINTASGWYDKRWGDIVDAHFYPGPLVCTPEEKRAVVTGEFGGLGFVTQGHMWKEGSWGYQDFTDRAAYADEYQRLWRRVHRLRSNKMNLSAAIYTQISDVETEANGLLTYDRAVEKIDRTEIVPANRDEMIPLSYIALLPLSHDQPQEWSYTVDKPPDAWARPDFDASSWMKGEGGFGTRYGMPDFVRTKWMTTDLWVRREFTVAAQGVERPLIVACYGVDSEIYINGVLACKPEGFHNGYGLYELNPEARSTVKPGTNIIAVHFMQKYKGGQQYIDIGLLDEVSSAPK